MIEAPKSILAMLISIMIKIYKPINGNEYIERESFCIFDRMSTRRK